MVNTFEHIPAITNKSACLQDLNSSLQTRMGSDRYPHLLLHGYTHGRRPKGRPMKKWLENISDDCKEMGVSVYEASQLATDRTRWRNTVRHELQAAARNDNVIVATAISHKSNSNVNSCPKCVVGTRIVHHQLLCVALAMRHRLQWFIHLRAQRL